MSKPIIIVEGAQYGSEAKGAVVGQLAIDKNVTHAVRTGSINAGHTVYFNGEAYKMQLLPVGWVNPSATLYLGPGCYVAPDLLEREVEWIAAAMNQTHQEVRDRIIIDHRCGVHLPSHHAIEANSNIHERMGSTGEGVAEALKDKMDRREDYLLFSQTTWAKDYKFADVSQLLNYAYDQGEQILLEGTQGTLLDLHLGHYPYVTSRQVSACAWATEAGLSPSLDYNVFLVVRAFPIRVAGNSGPLPFEIEWPDLLREMNEKRRKHGLLDRVDEFAIDELQVCLKEAADELDMPTWRASTFTPEERKQYRSGISNLYKTAITKLKEGTLDELKKTLELTTVTKKVRRIARLDPVELMQSATINRPSDVVITFLEYEFPTLFDVTTWAEIEASPEFPEIQAYIKRIEEATRARVSYVNTVPQGLIAVPQK